MFAIWRVIMQTGQNLGLGRRGATNGGTEWPQVGGVRGDSVGWGSCAAVVESDIESDIESDVESGVDSVVETSCVDILALL